METFNSLRTIMVGAMLAISLIYGWFLLHGLNRLSPVTDPATRRLRNTGGTLMLLTAMDILFRIMTSLYELHMGTKLINMTSCFIDIMLFGALNCLGVVMCTGRYPTRREWALFFALAFALGIMYGIWSEYTFMMDFILIHVITVKMIFSSYYFSKKLNPLNERMKEQFADLEHRQVIHYHHMMLPGIMLAISYMIQHFYVTDNVILALAHKILGIFTLLMINHSICYQKLDALYMILYPEENPSESSDSLTPTEVVLVNAREMYSEIETKLKALEAEQFYRGSEIDRTKLAHMLNTNRTYLSLYLKEVKKQTFFDYINNLRMEYAEKELLSREIKIKDLAKEAGYSSPIVFGSIFRKTYGMAAGEYKEEKMRNKK